MAFENIIGQQRVRNFFEKALKSERLSHAFLFVGERGVGKEAIALELAKALFCEKSGACSAEPCPNCIRVSKLSHPDLHFIFPAPVKDNKPEKKQEEIRIHERQILKSIAANPYHRVEVWPNPPISIKTIREIRRKSSYKSFEGRGRIVIIVDAERMSEEAANSVLKILEEPPEKMYLFLISSRPNLLLPTISSRCQLIKFEPLKAAEIEQALIENHNIEQKKARLTSRVASGSYRRAIELLDENLQEKQNQSLEFFRKSVQSEFTQIKYVDEVLKTCQRDLKQIKDLLSLLLIWFRDALVFRETDEPNQELLIYAGAFETLNNFTQKFPDADLQSAVNAIEESLEQISRNVQINLILIVLLNKLRTFVRR